MEDRTPQVTPYCRNRARDRVGYVFLGLLLLFLGICVGVYGFTLVGEDKTGWDYMEYVKLVIGCLAGRREDQGKGYGSAALAAAVWCLLERGKRPLLACREELVPFYAARGFVPAGAVWERI